MSEINTQDPIQELKELLDNGELSEGQVLTLAKKVLESGSEEAKYILRIDEFVNYCYDGTVYRRTFRIIYGDVKIIESYSHEDVCTKDSEYLIIPLSRIAIIIQEWEVEGFYVVYVFSSKYGWKSLTI